VGLALSTALAATDVRGVIPARAASGYLFNNWNTDGVVNGPPTYATTFTVPQAAQALQVADYHWNNGAGSPPGSIGLEETNNPGGTLKWFPAVGSAGQGGVANAAWVANVNMPIKANVEYTILDSNPATWSQNAQSGYEGFAWVSGNSVAAPLIATTTGISLYDRVYGCFRCRPGYFISASAVVSEALSPVQVTPTGYLDMTITGTNIIYGGTTINGQLTLRLAPSSSCPNYPNGPYTPPAYMACYPVSFSAVYPYGNKPLTITASFEGDASHAGSTAAPVTVQLT
jgi:hypothetical protein